MAANFRQTLFATVAVVGFYLLYFAIIAGIAQLQLIGGATIGLRVPTPLLHLLVMITLGLFLGVPFVIASGMPVAMMLHWFEIRSPLAYFGNAAVSGVLGAYAFGFNFAVADNLGAILLHVPKNGHSFADLWDYRAPPYKDTMASAFWDFPLLFRDEWSAMAVVTTLAIVFGLICCSSYWSRVVRPTYR